MDEIWSCKKYKSSSNLKTINNLCFFRASRFTCRLHFFIKFSALLSSTGSRCQCAYTQRHTHIGIVGMSRCLFYTHFLMFLMNQEQGNMLRKCAAILTKHKYYTNLCRQWPKTDSAKENGRSPSITAFEFSVKMRAIKINFIQFIIVEKIPFFKRFISKVKTKLDLIRFSHISAKGTQTFPRIYCTWSTIKLQSFQL